ncbi:TlpA disulfide reductase family protein [Pedobacter sp. MC2016-24]|uniref:TlpA disulfide reductase family protein n=1 Tax=Pedobacter sp. MC2016-24 TaxID=2780090 RepID=UPI001881BCF3|nr:TlpA disulfide reductase family protein [Pedobacter sp. MC2016-24]MBE9600332.1 TlpA family protein disulfide reductase [Pedobacter sp. MC2016-24]
MIKKMFLMICLVVAVQQLQAQVVEIKPENPQRGDKVTIIYHPGASGAKIGKGASSVDLNFTFSRFYELPLKLPMTRQGADWVTSFVLQRYATYASFTFQSGDLVDQPSAERHYNLKVYKGDKREKSSYLYEAYSLSAEMPKSPNLRPAQYALLQKELEIYPDNFEAKVYLQVVKMALAKTPADKQKERELVYQIISDKFEENPTVAANLNSVTAAFFTIGEKRTDSVYKMVLQRYPNSEIARDFKISAIAREQDTGLKIAQLEALLKQRDEQGNENAQQIHKILFRHYASVGNGDKSVYHASRSLGKKNPRTPEELKDIAGLLTANKLAPDTAIAYAEKSLKMVAQWPLGLIRYFPEYGYILPYVPESDRLTGIAEAKSTLYAIIALNKLYLGNRTEALNFAAQAEKQGANRESLIDVSKVYEQTGKPEQAFEALWQVLLKNPSDTAVIKLAKTNFSKFNNAEGAFTTKVKALEVLKNTQLKASLKKIMMHKPGPDLGKLMDLKGQAVTKEMMKNKIVILDFWATWCVPCMQEMPYLQKVYDKYKDHPRVMFMVVNSGARNTIKDAIGWEAKNPQYTFPLYFNNDPDIGEKVGFTVIPTIAVLDQNGLMQFRTIGFEGAELEHKLAAQIDVLLEQQR